MNDFQLQPLPPPVSLETPAIYRALTKASRALAELKGISKSIPDESILINTLGLQEAKDSSAIENIITTQDDLYRTTVDESYKNIAAKEVQNYADALKQGYALLQKNSLLTANNIQKIHQVLEPDKPGFRKLPGTVLKNSAGDIVYTPPQSYDEVTALMSNLEKYINDVDFHAVDPLIKMPVIHYQFESIHPFYDGNGRTGRIINILYLVQQGLLDIPVLYLSRYIIEHKAEYYKHLQAVRTNADWESWVMWLLDGIYETAIDTIEIINKIKLLMTDYKQRIRDEHKFYSQDLLNNLFKHPYTKIEFVERDLGISRPTATMYLNALADSGFLTKVKVWRSYFYVNLPLFELLADW